jgi:hypothetical protein
MMMMTPTVVRLMLGSGARLQGQEQQHPVGVCHPHPLGVRECIVSLSQ